MCVCVCIHMYLTNLNVKQLQSQAVAFGLIKSIIEKRLVCVEVYDVMEVIGQHLVSVFHMYTQMYRSYSARTFT
jgi:hypothetical protein